MTYWEHDGKIFLLRCHCIIYQQHPPLPLELALDSSFSGKRITAERADAETDDFDMGAG